jgi:phosphoserine phosphatase RsbU/P
MAVSRTLLRATALKGLPANECLTYVNDLLCPESISSMFVTIFYGILDTSTGEIEYANGGHNPPYLLCSEGRAVELELTGGIALGIMEEKIFSSRLVKLKPGEILFLFTDGVTEAFDINDNLYSDKRLESLLENSKTLEVKELVNKVVSDVNNYSTGVQQSDDITVMAIRYFGNNTNE